MNKLKLLTGEIGLEGDVIGEKGQSIQSITFRATEDCSLTIYAGKVKGRTASEEVIDRLAGRTPMKLLLDKLNLGHQESIRFNISIPLPITIIPNSKVQYIMEII